MAMKSWLSIHPDSHFSLANIPFGIITTADSKPPRPAIAIGLHALDLDIFTSKGGFSKLASVQHHLSVFSQPTLNAFAALGRSVHRDVRLYLQNVFVESTDYPEILKENQEMQSEALIPLGQVTTHLPLQIGHYTDFYAGRNHAYNIGVMFRGPNGALQPNYGHLPVAYHGRASSVVVSGTPIRRPCGQIVENPLAETRTPVFAPCKKLDFELELGAFVCNANTMGERVPITEAEDGIFGFVLLNDWSARDVQWWEYVPLGPFNSKNFASTVSPWVVLADALEPFKCKGLTNETELLPYLREKKEETSYNINLEVDLTSETTTTVTSTNSKNLLFSFPQMLAHHTSTGCPMQVGDLLGSGTISGEQPGSWGSMLETSKNGTVTLELGSEGRTFLEDGDTVTMRGWAGGEAGGRVGFGGCTGQIQPAKMP
ncbi:hypothetical protein MMC30_000845 [Trapelia coarctata]|nr:hypothetical protein [Trapelia coarctata]